MNLFQLSCQLIAWSRRQLWDGVTRRSHSDGRGMSLNHLRKSGLLIMNDNLVVKGIIFKGVTCCKLCSTFGSKRWHICQKEKRCIETPPFSLCEVNKFGLFIIREKRSDSKRYCALFTWFTSRAVHIEVTKTQTHSSRLLKELCHKEEALGQDNHIIIPTLWVLQTN